MDLAVRSRAEEISGADKEGKPAVCFVLSDLLEFHGNGRKVQSPYFWDLGKHRVPW